MTILSFLGIFATISSGPTTIAQGLLMVAGVFLGSMSWWFILGTAINKVKDKVPEIWFERIKLISAVILAAFGVFAVVSGLISLIF
jgi:putative LysE/RhtB family amino acid efflux pump